MNRHLLLSCALLITAALNCRSSEADNENRLKNSERTAAIVARRSQEIRRELKGISHQNSWAGEYYFGDARGVNGTLLLAPRSGFIFEWEGCLGLYDRNYGAAIEKRGVIELQCKFPNHPERGFEGVETKLVPLIWGERHYLIGASKLTEFCNAYNAGAEPRKEAQGRFSLRVGDEKKLARGKPPLPQPYASFLFNKPLTARVIEIKKTSFRKHKYGGGRSR